MLYPADAPASESLYAAARRVIPHGVNSPVRAFGAVGGTPRFMTRGVGPWIFDADGRRYVDLVGSWGPLILGHAHPDVIKAVTDAAAHGLSFGAPTAGEAALAEEIIARTGIDQVRLVSSGTEATMSALRLARAATGRAKVIKFAGHYHGHVDSLLAAAGSGVTTHGLPDSPGVIGAEHTIVLPYNNLAAVAEAFATHDVAAVITEAAAGNMGVVAPLDGFNRGLATLAHQHGALLIVDEVMTGFRVSANGWSGLDPADADLYTYGKVMGGGLPAAAFGGRAELMEQLAPGGPVYQAGTLSGNPVATAAGLATLRACGPEIYARLDDASLTISGLVSAALTETGVAHQISTAGNLFGVFFTSGEVRDYAGAQTQDLAAHRAFFHALLDHGVYAPPSAYEAWFVNAAIDDEALNVLTDAIGPAAEAAALAASPLAPPAARA